MNITSRPCIVASALLMVALIGVPEATAKYNGKVVKQTTRVARPALQAQTGEKTGFVFDAKAFEDGLNGAASSSPEPWNPWSSIDENQRPARMSIDTAANAAPVQIDYEAIEKAYAEAVPPAVIPAMVARAQTAISADENVALLANRMQQLQYQNMLAARNSAGGVDYDNCACGTAMPTSACTMSRMPGHGTNFSATAGNGQSVQTPVMSTFGNPPAVTPSAIRRAAGMNFLRR